MSFTCPRFFMRAITKIRLQSARALKKMTAGKGGKPAVIKNIRFVSRTMFIQTR